MTMSFFMKRYILFFFLFLSSFCYSSDDIKSSQKKISLDLVESPVRFVIQAISEHLDKGVVLTDSVQGNVSVKLNDVLPSDALDVILKSKGFKKIEQDGNYFILSNSDNSYSELIETKIIKLRYAKTSDIKQFFSENSNFLSKSGSILYDSRTNTVVISEVSSSLKRVVSIVDSLDLKLDQVEIEAQIIEVSTDYSKELGVKLSSFFSSSSSSGTFNFDGSSGDKSNFGFSILSGSFNLKLFFDALQKDGRVKIVSTPKILTLDNTKAVVSTGTQIPYQTSTITNSGTTTNTAFKNALLSLDVVPSISPDGDVLMLLSVTKDSPSGYAENGEVIISTNSLSTTVVVPNSQTIVLGGIYVDTDSSLVSSVPVLSNIPFLGNVFKNKLSSNVKKELLIFLTPRIIK